jgi:hypothetical protein
MRVTDLTQANRGGAKRRYTIAVDFDGVLHRYDTPWVAADVIPDPPVECAIDWLRSMLPRFKVVIFTTRGATARGRGAVLDWLQKHGLDDVSEIEVTCEKPPALVYIDDRAWRFEGRFPTAHEIHQARPWHKSWPT